MSGDDCDRTRTADYANANPPYALIRDEADYARHVEYCWINPLRHNLVRRVRDWPHSSFHRDVRAGLVPIDWGGEIDMRGDFGERR